LLEIESVAIHAVITRESGWSSIPRRPWLIWKAAAYRIPRWSLSSGSPKARPGGWLRQL